MEGPSLGGMLRCLRSIDDAAWGRYAFSLDMLRNRVPLSRQDEMTGKAIACGDEWARKMITRTGASDPDSMLKALGLILVENDAPMTSNRPLFAQFVPDRRVEIMGQPIALYSSLYQKEKEGADASLFPTPQEVRALLLAHEIFHFVEECNVKEIYSRTETIRLWEFLFIKWDSTVRAVGEIAAMSFAKVLTGAAYSPFILDVMLLFGYDPKMAESVFQRIMDISRGLS